MRSAPRLFVARQPVSHSNTDMKCESMIFLIFLNLISPSPPFRAHSGSDVNECLEGDFCFPRGECVNTDGSYKCVCAQGYKSGVNGTSCQGMTQDVIHSHGSYCYTAIYQQKELGNMKSKEKNVFLLLSS